MSSSPLRVLVVDDDPIARRVVADVILAEPGFELVGTARDVDTALATAQNRPPDVAVVDVNLPGGGGDTLTREIRARFPGTKVVAFSGLSNRQAVVSMLRAGAIGYVVKGSAAEEIVAAVRAAGAGHATISPLAAPRAVEELSDHFAAEEQAEALARSRLERINHVLDTERIDVVFQPIISLETRRVRGYEALARFPLDLTRPPDVWFAEAWDAGLGKEVELLAVRAALRHLDKLPGGAYLTINMSPVVAVARELPDALAQHDAARVVVEMTEHAPVHDYDVLAAALAPLRDDGVRVSVDDAGAGFSSLRHVLRLNPEFIKLDVSITRGIDSDRARHALARGLVSFASEIDTRIVGEGVETEPELEALRELGAACAQGFLLGPPGPLPAPGVIQL